MQALATGKGEIPDIVLRSGRASSRGMSAARGMAAYFVAAAYDCGSIVASDSITASEWFKRSAQLDYSPGQIMWGRALKHGKGVIASRDAAYSWFMRAHASGNPLAVKEMQIIEKP